MKASKLMLVNFSLIGERVGLDIFREPLLELFVAIEKLWHDEMQKSPELSHWILNWGTGEQESISSIELQQNSPPSAQIILDCLGLIQNHVMPFYSQKFLLILRCIRNQVVGGQQNIDSHIWVIQVLRVQKFSKFLSFFWTAEEREYL